jgi:enoyl-CoA hydratase/carnithine racemase
VEFLSTEISKEILVINLNRGVTNPIDLELVDQLNKVLQGAKPDPKIKGLVLSSSNEKFFSIGFNIPHLYKLNRADFSFYYKAFNRFCLDLFTFPKPTVAAISGHAIAGGCILALLCDYRLIAQGRKLMGLNEIKLGVPVPYIADCVLRYLVGAKIARDMMDTGDFYPAAELLNIGVVDQILPIEEVLPQSIEKARSLGSLPQHAFFLIKRNRVDLLEKQVLLNQEEKERLFVECWFSTQTRKLLKEAMDKF